MGEPAAPTATGRLEIRLFGEPDVRYGGASLRFSKRAVTLAMLALLILRRGSISRESLAFTLFPDSDEANALAELRRYLYLANKALPASAKAPWIVGDGETVSWNGSARAFVDVAEFERLASTPGEERSAVELYAGDLLENVYDDWVLPERERLRARYFQLLDALVERYRAARNFGEAAACAKRALSADPWREDIVRTLMTIRYESGDTAGALAEYDRFTRRLRDELATNAMPETLALRQSILRQEAVPGTLGAKAFAAEDEPRRRSISILPFVGRKRELTALYNAWGRAARGQAGLVLITGEAGIGKTRLTGELARTVQSEGGRVFLGTTSSPEAMPFQAIVEALRSGLPLLLARKISPERRTVLSPLLPELRDVESPEARFTETSADRAAARVYDALSFAVRALASPRPLLLVLEDLQWAGPSTIDALAAIVRDATRAPVLIVATSRREDVTATHPLRLLERALRAHVNVEELEPERLGEDEVNELVARVAGLSEKGDRVAEALYRRSEGNPLFLEAAIATIFESDDALPQSTGVAAVISKRMEQLGDEARAVAEIVAVTGSGCRVSLIRDVSNLPSTSVARGIDELLDRRILREAGARSGHDYVFSHHLLGDALYASIEPSFRAQRHFRVAECLRAAFELGQPVAARDVARHYEAAASHEEAARWYLTAARNAAAVHAQNDVVELATRALQNAPSSELKRAAIEARETARKLTGDREGQRADIEALAQIAAGDAWSEFDVQLRRVLLARAFGDSGEENRLISHLQTLAQSLGDSARAQALAQVATHAGLCSRSAEAIEPARQALALYESCDDLQGQLDCLRLLVEFTTNTGDLAEARRCLALMQERAANSTDRAVEARATAAAALATLLQQKYRDSFALTKRCLELYILLNDREGQASSRGRLAATATWLGDYAFALQEFEEALAIYESLENKRGIFTTQTNRAMLLARLGLFDEALASVERATQLFAIVRETRTAIANEVNASFVNLQTGDAAKAKRLAVSALKKAREIAYPVFEAAALANLGTAERLLGNPAAAIEHMEAGLAIRRSIQSPADFADDLADLTFAYLDAGRADDALAIARELVAIGSASFEGAFWPQYSWWAAAHGLAAGGGVDEARDARAKARSELAAFAERIADEKIRSAFLQIPVNRAIAQSAPQTGATG